MSQEFNDWWDGDDLTTNNLFEKDTPAFWAWEGWVAGVKAEREACAKVAENGLIGHTIAKAIRARSNK